MIIYNVTVKINKEIHDEWLRWMKDVHIPEVMNTGFFIENRICKVLLEEDDGVTYAVQYNCKSVKHLEEYQQIHAPLLQKEHNDRYKDKFVAFRTLLEVVE